MAFKDQLAKDVRSTFINPKEFATQHMIDDREMWVIVDSSESDSPLPYAEGTSLSKLTIHVDATELGYKPEEDQWISFDGTQHRVSHVDSDYIGVYIITLEANRS